MLSMDIQTFIGHGEVKMMIWVRYFMYLKVYYYFFVNYEFAGSRILANNYTIDRPDQEYARFSMLKHVKRKQTAPKLIYKFLDSAKTRWKTDGVNNTGLWTIKSVQKRKLYYHLLVDVGKPPKEWYGSS